MRSTFWLDTISELVVASGASSSQNLSSQLPATELRGSTLIRLLYDVWFYPASPFDSDTVQGLHMGIGLIQNDALAIGTTAMPDPGAGVDAPGRGWVVRDLGLCSSMVALSGNLQFGHLKGDIRAMRKFYQDVSLILLFRSDVEVGTAQSLNVFFQVRCLFKSK